ncbi:ABC transporter permease [Bacillus dakarensis]|uniref:ABC transporter permease n=1 Tax=Robertmurraya dakarensis TaxID=1926278 RepID=UPI000980B753|nr:ABC transporter permease [Bacillus dakarensis]
MQKLLKNDRLFNIVVPVFSALLGMLVGGIIMLLGGYNPITGFGALIDGMFGSPKGIGEMIRAASPLILAGLAVGFAFKTGLFNIGVEGQLLVGWLASVWVGYALDLPTVIHVPLAILAAALAGGIWGMIPGFLKARFKVHEVIVTIMLNYVALYVTADIIKRYLYAGNEKSYKINESASLSSEFLASITNGSRLHWGIAVTIIVAFIMWFILDKTTTGYELKAVGFNQHASMYAGMNVSKNIVLSMSISGAFAGVAGAMEGLGTFQNMTVLSAFTGTGFDGIAVALLGANNPFGIVIAGLLFGGLNTAAPQMNFNANVPQELVEIIIALIIFFVASGYLIRLILMRFSKEGK